MTLKICPKLVEKSSYARKLELIPTLREYLNRVSQYKALHKWHEMFYEKPADASHNKYYQELAKTEYRYYISERYSNFEFTFQPRNDNQNEKQLSFDIKEKTIPSIIEGLNAYEAKLKEWFASENEVSISADYYIERAIEEMFNKQELTPVQFELKKKLLIEQLREYANELEKDVG